MRHKTLQEEAAEAREAWLDLTFEILVPYLPLFRALGVKRFKPWIEERIIRRRHRELNR